MAISRAKQMLADGKPVIAVNIGGPSADHVEMLGKVGGDCAFIDCERGGISLESVGPMARAAQAYGMAAVVRSWSKDEAVLVQYLDRGIDGIVVPRVESAAEACAIVDTVRYACGKAAAEKIVVAQIESVRGIEYADEILAVHGIDVILIGPNDLAHSMGFAGDTSRTELKQAVDALAARLRAARRAFGLPVTAASAPEWVAKGAGFLYHPMEWLLRAALDQLKQQLPQQ
jgi:4-hydroxy-2-oxoheptanedioate aldolase